MASSTMTALRPKISLQAVGKQFAHISVLEDICLDVA